MAHIVSFGLCYCSTRKIRAGGYKSSAYITVTRRAVCLWNIFSRHSNFPSTLNTEGMTGRNSRHTINHMDGQKMRVRVKKTWLYKWRYDKNSNHALTIPSFFAVEKHLRFRMQCGEPYPFHFTKGVFLHSNVAFTLCICIFAYL